MENLKFWIKTLRLNDLEPCRIETTVGVQNLRWKSDEVKITDLEFPAERVQEVGKFHLTAAIHVGQDT